MDLQGIYRTLYAFNNISIHQQVPVPPGPKALKWFCCQPESSSVFPQFFISKETEDPSSKSLNIRNTRGVFGIGAAIIFVNSSSGTSQEQNLIGRFIL